MSDDYIEWRGMPYTRKYVQQLRDSRLRLMSKLLQAADSSPDPDVRGLAGRIRVFEQCIGEMSGQQGGDEK